MHRQAAGGEVVAVNFDPNVYCVPDPERGKPRLNYGLHRSPGKRRFRLACEFWLCKRWKILIQRRLPGNLDM